MNGEGSAPTGAIPHLSGAPHGRGIMVSDPAVSSGEVQAHSPLSSPTPNSNNRCCSKKLINFLFRYFIGVGMGLVAVFKARLSSHGGGRLIIYIPKSLQPKLREHYEKRVELVVHLYAED
jgi:hypothetical protein